MRASVMLIGAGLAFVLLVLVVVAGGNKATPAVASQGVAGVAVSGQGLTPQGTVLGKGSQQVGGLTLWLTAPVKAPARGQNVIEALVVNAAGQPVNDAAVSFDLDMTNMSHGRNVVQAQRVDDGRYDSNVTFMMPGPWRIIATVERGGTAVGSARFDFNVNLR